MTHAWESLNHALEPKFLKELKKSEIFWLSFVSGERPVFGEVWPVRVLH